MNKFMNFAANVQNVFNNDENDFKAFSQLMIDTARGKQSVSKEEANAKIVEVFQGVLGIDENSRPNDVRKAIRRNQALVFDILEETLETLLTTDWGNNPFFERFVEQRNLALGDKNEFFIADDSIMSVMKIANGTHDIVRQRLGAGSVKSIETYWVGAKVYAEAERLVMGVEDFAHFINKIYDAYDRYIKNAIYDTMVGYANNLSGMFKKTGSLTEANLRDLCDLVSTAMNQDVMIMGTRTAISKVNALTNVDYLSSNMKDELHRTGTMALWQGIEIIELPQVFEKNKVGQYKLDNDVLWIMPKSEERFIKLVNEGDMQIFQVSDAATNRDMTNEYEVMQKLGIGILLNGCFGVYKIQ